MQINTFSVLKKIRYAIYGALGLILLSCLISFLSMPFLSDGYYVDLIYFFESGNLLDNGTLVSESAYIMVPLSYVAVVLITYCIYARVKKKNKLAKG